LLPRRERYRHLADKVRDIGFVAVGTLLSGMTA